MIIIIVWIVCIIQHVISLVQINPRLVIWWCYLVSPPSPSLSTPFIVEYSAHWKDVFIERKKYTCIIIFKHTEQVNILNTGTQRTGKTCLHIKCSFKFITSRLTEKLGKCVGHCTAGPPVSQETQPADTEILPFSLVIMCKCHCFTKVFPFSTITWSAVKLDI